MLKKRFLWLIIIALVVCGVNLQAQEKAAPTGPEKVMLFNGEQLKIQLYGIVRLDGVYNEKNVVCEIGPMFVSNSKFLLLPFAGAGTYVQGANNTFPGLLLSGWASQPPSMNQGSLLFDVRWTRLGLNFTGPKCLGADTGGKIEIDFWGNTPTGGASAKNGMPRMRHGYFDINWKGEMWGVNVRAGQDFSLVMPIYAAPLTNSPLPYFEKGFLFLWDLGAVLGVRVGTESINVLLEGGIARVQAGNDAVTANPGSSIASNNLYPGMSNVQVDERGAGEASKRPGWRGRVTLKVAPSKLFSLYAGVTGHYQIEKQGMTFFNLNNSWTSGVGLYGLNNPSLTLLSATQRIGKEVVSKSVGAFARVTVAMVSFVAAGFKGWNMDGFLGGLAQGAVESTSGLKLVPVQTTGGYAQVQIFLAPVGIPLTLATGIGKAQKLNNMHIGIGQILDNRIITGMITWHMNQYVNWSWEIENLSTHYKARMGNDTNMTYRSQLNFTF